MRMQRPFLAPLLAVFFSYAVEAAPAEEVTIEHQGITLNARLARTEGWPRGPVVLMVHGTFAHNQMEIMATIQELLTDAELSSLAINLSLSVDDRHGTFACETPHAHRDSDALDEIGEILAEDLAGTSLQ